MTRLIAVRPWPRFALAAANDSFPKVPTMTFPTTAAVPTTHGSRYLQQLCKHWAHNLAVAFTPDHGTVTFRRDARGADHPGDALVTFESEVELIKAEFGDNFEVVYPKRTILAAHAKEFPKVETFTVDEVFGTWKSAQKTHFDDGGTYDQILAATHRQ